MIYNLFICLHIKTNLSNQIWCRNKLKLGLSFKLGFIRILFSLFEKAKNDEIDAQKKSKQSEEISHVTSLNTTRCSQNDNINQLLYGNINFEKG